MTSTFKNNCPAKGRFACILGIWAEVGPVIQLFFPSLLAYFSCIHWALLTSGSSLMVLVDIADGLGLSGARILLPAFILPPNSSNKLIKIIMIINTYNLLPFGASGPTSPYNVKGGESV